MSSGTFAARIEELDDRARYSTEVIMRRWVLWIVGRGRGSGFARGPGRSAGQRGRVGVAVPGVGASVDSGGTSGLLPPPPYAYPYYYYPSYPSYPYYRIAPPYGRVSSPLARATTTADRHRLLRPSWAVLQPRAVLPGSAGPGARVSQ